MMYRMGELSSYVIFLFLLFDYKNHDDGILFANCLMIPNQHGIRHYKHKSMSNRYQNSNRHSYRTSLYTRMKSNAQESNIEQSRRIRNTRITREGKEESALTNPKNPGAQGLQSIDQTKSLVKEEDEWRGIPIDRVAKPFGVLLVAQFVLFLGVGAVIPTLPLYGKEIGLSSAANGVVISAPAIMLLLLAKPAGMLADQRGRKPAMIGGMLIIALSDLGTACASSFLPLIVARLGLGAGRVISESGERGMLADLASRAPNLRGRALAAQQACTALGIAIGAPLGGIIVEQYGPRSAFLCVTAAALASLLIYTFLPETIAIKHKGEGEDESLSDSIKKMWTTTNNNLDGNDGSNVEWRDLLQDKRWRGLSLCEVGIKFGYAAKLTCIPILATQILPGGAIGAGTLLSAAGLTGLVGSPMGGWMTDRLSAKQTSILSGSIAGLALIGIPIVLSQQHPQTGLTVCVLIWSLAVAALSPALTAMGQQIAPFGEEATAMSLPRASGDAVYLVAPFLLGVIADNPSLPMATECAMAGVFTLLGIFALFLLS